MHALPFGRAGAQSPRDLLPVLARGARERAQSEYSGADERCEGCLDRMVGSRVLGIAEHLANFENVWYDITVAVSRAGYLADAYPQQLKRRNTT